MKKLGMALVAIGWLTVFGSFGLDTAPEGTHNIGLMQEQIMIFSLGALSTIVGAIAAAAGTVLERLPTISAQEV